MTLTVDRRLAPALGFIAAAAGRGEGFRPDELPGCDALEQVALCARLHSLDALCGAGARAADEAARGGRGDGRGDGQGWREGGRGRGRVEY